MNCSNRPLSFNEPTSWLSSLLISLASCSLKSVNVPVVVMTMEIMKVIIIVMIRFLRGEAFIQKLGYI
jgi:hypothetical protein